MKDQMIITISREFGSGGHEIAAKLAHDLGLKIYDRGMLDEIAEQKNMSIEDLNDHDERPRNPLLSRRVGEHTNSMEEHVAQMQFDFLREKAESGESFVVVGRCSETVLKDFPVISFFVRGDEEEKIERTMEIYSLKRMQAAAKMKRHDRKRKMYHNAHSDFKWGDVNGYDMCVDSSRLGVDKCVELLKHYITLRTEQ